MRLAAILLLVGACYRPSAPGGAPCDPLAPHCPSGQQCFAGTCGTESTIFEDAPAELVDGTLLGDAHPTDAPIALDAGPLHLDYIATVANCINPQAPDLTTCTASKGASQLVVDTDDLGHPLFAFVRFDLDGQLAGRTPSSVTLTLTTTTNASAGGSQSGDIWRVTAFTQASLATAVPTQIQMVVASFGPVTVDTPVVFDLPSSIAAANQPIFLGIYPKVADSVHYWDLTGPAPPRLHVDAP